MRRRWVADASPVILLAKVEHVDLLTRLPDELVVPRAVAEEIHAGLPDDPARQWMQEAGRTFVRPVQSVASEVAAWDLGRGEAAVLSWAYRRPEPWTVLLDDGAARRAARALDVHVSGTLGVVLAAKQEGAIGPVRPVLKALVQAGLRVSEPVLEQALRYAGEAK